VVWLIRVGFRNVLSDCLDYQSSGSGAVAPSANNIADSATRDGVDRQGTARSGAERGHFPHPVVRTQRFSRRSSLSGSWDGR